MKTRHIGFDMLDVVHIQQTVMSIKKNIYLCYCELGKYVVVKQRSQQNGKNMYCIKEKKIIKKIID